ncbi:formimidoylglutamate deiminase [Sedimentitalea todarodis]|uniref:Formimidoylglutamate deiminase n=1 Tax=Sedimentitalea todarodis TaxID=1631240 RepID=A0ABU3VIS6_9RHOB|nr:formimidoylglutamate deiminase [Sedimentitalea todarodis]MDU9006072.1 formimidoylglutamate deiminase [Sedimentitalea todarodis]
MIHARHALLSSGWERDVRVAMRDGIITTIECDVAPASSDVRVDTLLPALGNLHSHTFQRAMAGMTEFRKAGRDSFWTWRDLMYRFMDRLTPEQIEAIAALVFVEMQEAGYASVGEFHYVHHQTGGSRYDNLAELSHRIFAAASTTGIGLTHLPVLYTYGGAGQAALADGQLRFGNGVEAYLTLVEAALEGLTNLLPDARIGIAPHSLRATAPDDLRAVLSAHPDGPVHIHIAEQPKEVTDIKAWLGQRPVDWLLSHANVNDSWCLIHATHMTDDETRAMAGSGAVAGLCPITEANLGDGPFNGAIHLMANGAFGVGSDSNVNISLTEELRTLEYSQRLRDLARNVMVVGEGSVGHTLYTGAAQGGAQALGRNGGEIAVDRLADLVAIDSTDPALCALSREQILDGLVFAAKDRVVTDLWSAGRHCVTGGRHIAREDVVSTYRAAITDLLASL